ncbi:hypothetical protein [Urechidicola sp. KH5]
MKKLSILALLCVMIAGVSCKKVGGACEYIDYVVKANPTFIDGNLKGDFIVSFQALNSEDEVYRIESSEFFDKSEDIELTELQNKDAIFTITMEQISKGTCTPVVIINVALDQP